MGFCGSRPVTERKKPGGHEDRRDRHERATEPGERAVDEARGIRGEQDDDAENQQDRGVGVAGPEEVALQQVRLDVAAHHSGEEVAAGFDGDESEEQNADRDRGLWLDSHSIQC